MIIIINIIIIIIVIFLTHPSALYYFLVKSVSSGQIGHHYSWMIRIKLVSTYRILSGGSYDSGTHVP